MNEVPYNVGLIPPEEALKYTGLDLLTKMKSGELPIPPFVHHLKLQFTTIEDSHAVFSMVPEMSLFNGLGCLHGGIISTLLDTAMACAIQTKLPVGKTYTTLEFKINFIRPVYERTGLIHAQGRLIHYGRTTATAEGRLLDERGKIYAFGNTTCIIIRPPSQENATHH